MIIDFKCSIKRGKKSEEWFGKITKIIRFASCLHEVHILSRSSIRLFIAQTPNGNYAFIPDYDAGCHLADLKDLFWNSERLIKVLGKVDGITSAHAIFEVADRIAF